MMLLACAGLHAQDDLTIKKKNCYDRSTALKGKRFVDFECGKTAGVIDCNEKLEFDEGSNTLFSASSGSPFNGTCETCHQNGLLEHRIKFINGKEDGPDTTYYESGCMMVVRNHIVGKETGLWTYYYDSTNRIAWEMNYLNGQKNGKQVFLGPKGDTTLYETYLNGVLHGVKKTYYAKSKVEKQVTYTNGVFNGPFITYNKEGKILQSVNYKQGKKNGVATYYYDDGVLLRTENWDMDARNGEFKTLYYEQNVQSIENYKKNKNYKESRLDAEVYECSTRAMADEVYKMLGEKQNAKQITEKINDKAGLRISSNKSLDEANTPYLKDVKVKEGPNEPIPFEQKFYVIKVNSKFTTFPVDVKEGWFEERFPDNKLKRRALYRNNVLLEEHVYNEQGKEIKTFGAKSSKGAEDDQVPVDKKKKKEKK